MDLHDFKSTQVAVGMTAYQMDLHDFKSTQVAVGMTASEVLMSTHRLAKPCPSHTTWPIGLDLTSTKNG